MKRLHEVRDVHSILACLIQEELEVERFVVRIRMRNGVMAIGCASIFGQLNHVFLKLIVLLEKIDDNLVLV